MCFIKKQIGRPKPMLRRTISSSELGDIIRGVFPQGKIYHGDHEYDLCDIQDIEAFLDADETNHKKYSARIFDCENFARMLWGQFGTPEWGRFAIGLIWTDTHGMVICVDANEDVWLIEPQTDARRSGLLDWQGSVMRFSVWG